MSERTALLLPGSAGQADASAPANGRSAAPSGDWGLCRCLVAIIVAPLALLVLFVAPAMQRKAVEGKCRPDSGEGAGGSWPADIPMEGDGNGSAAEILARLTGQEKCEFIRGHSSEYVGGTPPVRRLGLPGLRMMDAAQGFRTILPQHVGQVTAWPCLLAVAATWNVALVERFGVALGDEFRAKGANVVLGPSVNLHRQARGGRNAEFLSGEDPFLGAALTAPYVRGVQSRGVLAVVKHLAVNNQETNRMSVSSNVDARSLWEVYYAPFRAAIKEGVASVMCAYNSVNGTSACASDDLLIRDLKESMGFHGWVMSDWWATYSFSAMQGLDQSMPVGECSIFTTHRCWFDNMHLRSLSDEKLDDMVARVIAPMVKHGLMDHSCNPKECTFRFRHAVATSSEHKALARRMAAESVLLLKNEGSVLPIQATTRRIAILGSACDAPNDVSSLLSRWDIGNAYVIGGSGRVVPAKAVSVYQGIVEQVPHDAELLLELTDNAGDALEVGKKAEVAIICGSATTAEGADRPSLQIDQQQFVQKVSAGLAQDGIPVIAVVLAPGSVVMPWMNHVNAALVMFLGGEATGHAIADVLYGQVNPSGKSPVTFYREERDAEVVPCEQTRCDYSEGLFLAWRGMQNKSVLFPFGHGLSYSTWKYEWHEKPAAGGHCAEVICCSISVTNEGDRGGAEVVQLYVTFPHHLREPSLVLRGFEKVNIAAKETVQVSFALRKADLEVYLGGGWQQSDGSYELHIGSSSRDIRLSGSFHVEAGSAKAG